MSVRATATFNQPLTTYAQGLAQDRAAAERLAQILCPIVQVPSASGTYKKFDDRNAFLVADTRRGIGGSRQRLQFEATDGTYNCAPHGLEIGVDDFESDLVGAGQRGAEVGQMLLDQGKIKSLVSRKWTSYVKRVYDFVIANLTPVANRGNFSNDAIDPIDQINEQLNAVATVVGSTENISLVISLVDWLKILGNAKVKARIGLTGNISLTPQQFISGLAIPVKVEITAISLVSAKFGQTGSSLQSKSQIVSGSCLILYSQPNPTPMDPSAFKCFSTSNVLIDGVRTYRDETSNSDIHAVDWSEDLEATGTACARLLAVT